MRWFAEALWYPTALLPSQAVRWEAVDDHSAKATGNKLVLAPWEGIWSNYQVRDGVLVPLTGEVAWMRPEGRKPYFVGEVTALAFEFST